MLRACLQNPDNLCYANSTLQMFLWHGLVMMDLVRRCGRGRQQDAAELLGFLLEYARPLAYDGL